MSPTVSPEQHGETATTAPRTAPPDAPPAFSCSHCKLPVHSQVMVRALGLRGHGGSVGTQAMSTGSRSCAAWLPQESCPHAADTHRCAPGAERSRAHGAAVLPREQSCPQGETENNRCNKWINENLPENRQREVIFLPFVNNLHLRVTLIVSL